MGEDYIFIFNSLILEVQGNVYCQQLLFTYDDHFENDPTKTYHRIC